MPLRFEPNRGQAGPSVRFIARAQGRTYLLSAAEALALPPATALGARGANSEPVRLRLTGGDPTAAVTGEAPQGSVSHYYRGNDPSRWITDVPHFGSVRFASVYPGIDVVYHAAPEGAGSLEYDFIVAPGADPAQVRLEVSGSGAPRLDARGDLVVNSAGGEFRQRRPVAYQEIGAVRKTVPCGYVLDAPDPHGRSQSVRISAGSYDLTQPLVIDPVISYSTYLGGSSADIVNAVAAFPDGRCVVGGRTNSSDFSASSGDRGGSNDGFLAVFNATGRLLAAAYLGGAARDRLRDLAVRVPTSITDSELIVAGGETDSVDFPRPDGIFGPQGGTDGFLAVFGSSLALASATYLGGTDVDTVRGVAVSGSLITAVGVTGSTNFPLQQALFPDAAGDDAFVSQFLLPLFASRLDSLSFSTYLGGTGRESANDVAVSAGDTVTVVGDTRSPDFPTLNPVHPFRGGTDGFVTRISGRSMEYSTFLGGTGLDFLTGVTGGQSPVVLGVTTSSDFPVVRALFPEPLSSEDESLVLARLTPSGSALEFGTYLNGGRPNAQGVAEDVSGIYVCAETVGFGFPLRDPLLPLPTGGRNLALAKLRLDGSAIIYATLLGGSRGAAARGVAVDAEGNAFVVGSTTSLDFPLLNPAQPFSHGGAEGFVTEIAHLDAPSDVLLTVRSQTDIRVEWRDNSFNETGFEVERRVGAGDFDRVAVVAGSTVFQDTALSANTRYTYRIRAVNSSGASAFTFPASAFTTPNPPAAPGGLAAVARSSSQIELRWVDNSSNETGFSVERSTDGLSFTTITNLPANSVSFVNGFLAAGTVFHYRVRAFNTGGNSQFSNQVSAQTLLVPRPPSEARALPLSGTAVRVQWRDNSVFEVEFQVERRGPSGGFARVGTTPQNGTSFVDTGLTAGDNYTYRVRATNAARESSPYSNEAAVLLPRGALRAPRSVRFDPIPKGGSRTRTITIANDSSTESLYVKVGEAGGPFTVTFGGGEAILPPGGRQRVTITFRPRRRGRAVGSVGLESSDPARPTHRIRLEGRGQ